MRDFVSEVHAVRDYFIPGRFHAESNDNGVFRPDCGDNGARRII